MSEHQNDEQDRDPHNGRERHDPKINADRMLDCLDELLKKDADLFSVDRN